MKVQPNLHVADQSQQFSLVPRKKHDQPVLHPFSTFQSHLQYQGLASPDVYSQTREQLRPKVFATDIICKSCPLRYFYSNRFKPQAAFMLHYVGPFQERDQRQQNLELYRCQVPQCSRPVFDAIKQFCKHHLAKRVKQMLRVGFKTIFQGGPDKAYNTLDFTGRGYIMKEDILNSIVVARMLKEVTLDDIKLSLEISNLFTSAVTNSKSTTQNPPGSMTYDSFKKIFFPHLYVVAQEQGSDEEAEIRKNQTEMINNQSVQSQKIEARLRELDRRLRIKFSSSYESVRKAFLALDHDYDGYITVEDLFKRFGNQPDIKYEDLKKLIVDKDSKKIGRLNYSDFSRWLGSSIHQSEGFYFRHDSHKNPAFDKNLTRFNQNVQEMRKITADESDTLLRKVLNKIRFQWKTLRKAFMDLNVEKTGSIKPRELRFYLEHWGMIFTSESFHGLFGKLDHDGDGQISYKDFVQTAGKEIHPAEGLYFRQDKPHVQKINSCSQDMCWAAVPPNTNYCTLHQKVFIEKAAYLLNLVFHKIGKQWTEFVQALRMQTDNDDPDQIFLEDFQSILGDYNVQLSENSTNLLLDAMPGHHVGVRKRLNMTQVYQQKFSVLQQGFYDKVDVFEDDGTYDAKDNAGYTGQMIRVKKKLSPISDLDFLMLLRQDIRINQVWNMIRRIDPDRNGFVTITELDDIFKIAFPELDDTNLSTIFRPFCSIQNKVLVDYKRFQFTINEHCRHFEEAEQLQNQQRKPKLGEQSPNKYSLVRPKDPIKVKKALQGQKKRDLDSYLSQPGEDQSRGLSQTRYSIAEHVAEQLPRRKSVECFSEQKRSLHQNDASHRLTQVSMSNIKERRGLVSTEDEIQNEGGQYLSPGLKKYSSTLELSPKKYHSHVIGGGQEISDMKKIMSSHTHGRSTISPERSANRRDGVDLQQNYIEKIKGKVGYEWKRIYKNFSIIDREQLGTVTQEGFMDACRAAGLRNISREDTKKLLEFFGTQDQKLNYQQMSKELGLHFASLNQVHKNVMRRQNLEKIRRIVNQQPHDADRLTNLSQLLKEDDLKLFQDENPVEGVSLKQSSRPISPQSRYLEKQQMQLQQGHSAQEQLLKQDREKVQQILTRRKTDFLNLVRMHQRKAGLQSDLDRNTIIPVEDFKTCLRAFKLPVSSQDLNRFLKRIPKRNTQENGTAVQSPSSSSQYRVNAAPRSQSRERSNSTSAWSHNAGVRGGAGIDANEFVNAFT